MLAALIIAIYETSFRSMIVPHHFGKPFAALHARTTRGGRTPWHVWYFSAIERQVRDEETGADVGVYSVQSASALLHNACFHRFQCDNLDST